jgi:hypothetical protein
LWWTHSPGAAKQFALPARLAGTPSDTKAIPYDMPLQLLRWYRQALLELEFARLRAESHGLEHSGNRTSGQSTFMVEIEPIYCGAIAVRSHTRRCGGRLYAS